MPISNLLSFLLFDPINFLNYYFEESQKEGKIRSDSDRFGLVFFALGLLLFVARILWGGVASMTPPINQMNAYEKLCVLLFIILVLIGTILTFVLLVHALPWLIYQITYYILKKKEVPSLIMRSKDIVAYIWALAGIHTFLVIFFFLLPDLVGLSYWILKNQLGSTEGIAIYFSSGALLEISIFQKGYIVTLLCIVYTFVLYCYALAIKKVTT